MKGWLGCGRRGRLDDDAYKIEDWIVGELVKDIVCKFSVRSRREFDGEIFKCVISRKLVYGVRLLNIHEDGSYSNKILKQYRCY